MPDNYFDLICFPPIQPFLVLSIILPKFFFLSHFLKKNSASLLHLKYLVFRLNPSDTFCGCFFSGNKNYGMRVFDIPLLLVSSNDY